MKTSVLALAALLAVSFNPVVYAQASAPKAAASAASAPKAAASAVAPAASAPKEVKKVKG